MFFISLFLACTIAGQIDFSTSLSTIQQLYEYQVDITREKGGVLLSSNPATEGGATAWFYVDEEVEIGMDDALVLTTSVTANNLRVKYLFFRENTQAYWGGIEIIEPQKGMQTITIPLKDAKPFYNGNYPFSLTPGKTPALFIFIDNELPGRFEAEINGISVIKAKTGGAR